MVQEQCSSGPRRLLSHWEPEQSPYCSRHVNVCCVCQQQSSVFRIAWLIARLCSGLTPVFSNVQGLADSWECSR